MEVFIQFVVGVFDEDLVYIDDWRRIAAINLMSVSGFWFDCATSIPWSLMDLHFDLVGAPPPILRMAGYAAAPV